MRPLQLYRDSVRMTRRTLTLWDRAQLLVLSLRMWLLLRQMARRARASNAQWLP